MQQVAAHKTDIAALPFSASSTAKAVETGIGTQQQANSENNQAFEQLYQEAKSSKSDFALSDKETLRSKPLETTLSTSTTAGTSASTDTIKKSKDGDEGHTDFPVEKRVTNEPAESAPAAKEQNAAVGLKQIVEGAEAQRSAGYKPNTSLAIDETEGKIEPKGTTEAEFVIGEGGKKDAEAGVITTPGAPDGKPDKAEEEPDWVAYVETLAGRFGKAKNKEPTQGESGNRTTNGISEVSDEAVNILSVKENGKLWKIPDDVDVSDAPSVMAHLLSQLNIGSSEGEVAVESLSTDAQQTLSALTELLIGAKSEQNRAGSERNDDNGEANPEQSKNLANDKLDSNSNELSVLVAQLMQQKESDGFVNQSADTTNESVNTFIARVAQLINGGSVDDAEQVTEAGTEYDNPHLNARAMSMYSDSGHIIERANDVGSQSYDAQLASSDKFTLHDDGDKAQQVIYTETQIRDVLDEALSESKNSADESFVLSLLSDELEAMQELPSDEASLQIEVLNSDKVSEMVTEVAVLENGGVNTSGADKNKVAVSDTAPVMNTQSSIPQNTSFEMTGDSQRDLLTALSELSPQTAQKATEAFAERVVTAMPSGSQQQAVKSNIIAGINEFQQQVQQGREPGIDLSTIVADAAKDAAVSADVVASMTARVDGQASQFLNLMTQTQASAQHAIAGLVNPTESVMQENSQLRAEASKTQQQFEGFDKAVNIHKSDGQQQLSEKIRWMVNARNTMAEIRLDPPELGSMQVRVNVAGDAASVSFVVQSQQAKDALADAMPKLRDMLSEQGIELGDAQVRKDNSSGQENGQQLAGNSHQGQGAGDRGENDGVDDTDGMRVIEQSISRADKGGIDFYA